ncbi:hypothetical protein A2803_01480 [Candidatus Woesebacteria bacterium RIFCSPHIGHO2_01_FULL_44_21]|uniref:Uncharacterized protein n=1 Tax=Candidatus Woesebacteria bacterium RIFCSPHIGHO2_01_FULL_44_21 TaxID=1802503 RepID=A0A1F7YZJ3_9BACT|nr:MAG: hypothetical protein A2803_01480 [Candidatus Woesebacteria bacterium RIFCSPHIGHO2_01_FULL_44_21]
MNLGDAFRSPIGRDLSVGAIIGNLVSAAIVVAGIIMVFLFIGGGLMMIVGAGNNDPQSAAKGKQAVTWAIVGFVIVFTSYWVIRIIEIWSGTNFVTIPSFFGGQPPPAPRPGGPPVPIP